MTRAMISELNTIAAEDFEKAKAMLEGINLVLGTKYGWLAGRVVFFDKPNGTVAERYASAHDAWAYAELIFFTKKIRKCEIKTRTCKKSMNELSEKDKGSVGHNDKLGIWLGM